MCNISFSVCCSWCCHCSRLSLLLLLLLFCFVLFWSVALLAEFYSAVVPIDVAVAAVAAATEFMF